MPTARSIRATLILATFLAGMIVAPLSHYAYMALGDAYAPAGMAASHHAGMRHATDMPASLPDAPSVSGKTEVLVCDYWSLFATFAAIDAGQPSLLIAPDRGTHHNAYPADQPLPVAPSTAHLRGPPAA
ncbi:MAG: hypothetical protein R2834_23995 [Rhodothermales bacterium]